MNISTIGIDLAKDVFQVHEVDEHGKVVLRKTLKRAELLRSFAQLPPCLVGVETCSGAHFWSRQIGSLGHDASEPAHVN